MIGVYDFTVIFTYLSLMSSILGIFLTIEGHPFLGILCLMISSFFDGFDGKIASLKKNRTELSKKFGIQIDSLTDLIAFGVLPACIGFILMQQSSLFQEFYSQNPYGVYFSYASYIFFFFYVLAALTRLAYYNVTEEERQKVETGSRSYFVGLPVTSAYFVFPAVILFSKFFSFDVALCYMIAMVIVSFAFILKFHFPKPKFRDLILLVILGIVEFFVFFFSCVL